MHAITIPYDTIRAREGQRLERVANTIIYFLTIIIIIHILIG